MARADDPFHGGHSKDDIYERRQWAVMSGAAAEAIGPWMRRENDLKSATIELQIIRIPRSVQ